MKLVFMGTPLPAVASLERLAADGHEIAAVWTQPDRPAGRGRKLSPPPVKGAAMRLGIPVLQWKKIKTDEALQAFESSGAEAAVVVAYGRILPKTFLEAFPKGCINVHFSLLPKYRGAAPVNWAIVNGEEVTGVTTMLMDEGLDTGDILLQRETPIGADETAPELMNRLSTMGADLISETLRKFDCIEPRAQDDDEASLAPLMSKEDGRIDWTMTADQISRRVRGFQPFPRSYGMLGGTRITFWKCRAADASSTDAPPGTILEAPSGEVRIACGGGTVLLAEELQQEGKRRMASADFLNGAKVVPGDRFDI